MLGWLSSTAVFASPTNLRTKASSEASSGRICLTTSRFSNPTAPRSVARYTRAMPPAAISRSSTYLPKICGYTGYEGSGIQRIGRGGPPSLAHRGGDSCAVRRLGLALSIAALCGCTEAEPGPVLRVSTHGLAACPVPEGARLFLTAVGDFSASESTSDALPLGAAGDLAAPPSTQAFEARVELGGARFHGYAERTTSPELPILLWPEGSACRVRGAADYPAPGGGQAVGFDPASRTALVVGGGSVELPSASVAALAFDTGTGAIRSDASPEASLREPRAHASVTPFGSGLLVAGGENPVHGDAGALAQPRDTAERFDPASGRFTGSVALVEPRARHAAVVLASGETLLVGGRGALGAALRVLEVVSPGSMTGSIAGLPALRAPRLSPSAFLLDDGRLFVGGGTSADGAPLSALEWLSGDAR